MTHDEAIAAVRAALDDYCDCPCTLTASALADAVDDLRAAAVVAEVLERCAS